MGYPSPTRARSIEVALDPARKAAIVELALERLKANETLAEAAQSANIGRRALKSWIESNPEWKERFDDIDQAVTDRVEKTAIELACEDKNPRMVEFLLERRSDRYKAKLELTHKQALSMDDVADRFRQMALANPTLTQTIRMALQKALDRLPA